MANRDRQTDRDNYYNYYRNLFFDYIYIYIYIYKLIANFHLFHRLKLHHSPSENSTISFETASNSRSGIRIKIIILNKSTGRRI